MSRFARKSNQKGFTMVELMVVVVIIGVLAAIAIPMYGKYVKNARMTEATARIGEIVTAAKSWAIENENASGNPIWPSGTSGIFDLTQSESFTYSITSGGGTNATSTAFVLLATGRSGTRMAGVTVSVTVPNIHSNGNAPAVTGL